MQTNSKIFYYLPPHDTKAMSGHAASSELKPLLGVVLCCTALQPERRSELAAIAEELGAIHRLDLTSDVTHLLVGNIDTPKYVFVARERPEVKVLFPAWIEAVRDSWTQGGDVDIEALEAKCQLPTFYGAQICVTGFEDIDERTEMAQSFLANGARYHGDLTREVSHLVAAAPKGKKYEYASQWGLKVVSIEWVRDSLARGMVLDEKLYHPTIPEAERGKGATRRPQAPSPLGKRKLAEARLVRNASDAAGRARKLRRTASVRCESQGDDLWADMGSIDEGKKQTPVGDAEWEEENLLHKSSRTISRTSFSSSNTARNSHAVSANPAQTPQGIFSGTRLFLIGFPHRHETLLQKILPANGAVLLTVEDMQARPENDDRVFALVPHQKSRKEAERNSHTTPHDVFLTEFWVEKCLSDKCLVDHTRVPLCSPFASTNLSGLNGLTVCPSSFAGVDLLHFKKAAELLGARYDESLHKTTSVLVCNNGDPNMGKLAYALDHKIPVVHAEWFWQCIRRCKVLPFERFVPQACQEYIREQATAREASPKPQRKAAGTTIDEDIPQRRIDSQKPRSSAQRALQELPPDMNSPTKAGSQERVAESFAAAKKEDKVVLPKAAELDGVVQNRALNSAIADLIAQRREKASVTRKDALRPTDRRQRKLGRAQSNPSTMNSRLSLSHSQSQMHAHSLHGGAHDSFDSPLAGPEVAPPSQSLTYDDPEAAAARERLMRRKGGDDAWQDDETPKGRTKVESIGTVKDYSLAGEERRSARRIGTRRQTGALDGGDDW